MQFKLPEKLGKYQYCYLYLLTIAKTEEEKDGSAKKCKNVINWVGKHLHRFLNAEYVYRNRNIISSTLYQIP